MVDIKILTESNITRLEVEIEEYLGLGYEIKGFSITDSISLPIHSVLLSKR